MSTAPPSSSAAPPVPPAAPPAPAERVERDGWPLPNWPWWIGPVALVGGLVTTIFVGSFIAAAAGFSKAPAWFDLTTTYIQDVALILFVIALAALRGRPRAAEFGLRRPPLRLAVAWVGAGAGAYVLFNLIFAALVQTKAKEELPQKLGADKSTVALVAVVVLVCVLAPVAEELVFRGAFFPALWRRFGLWAGILPTALTFGVIHAVSAPAVFLVILTFFGLVLCVVRWRTASLLPCIVLHATNNAVVISTLEHWSAAGGLALVLGANALLLAILVPLSAPASALAGSRSITQ